VITMSTTTPEYLTTLRDGYTDAVQQWMDQSATVWDQWSQAWSPAVAAVGLRMPGAPDTSRRHHHEHAHRHDEHDCGCGDSRHGCREQGHHHGTPHEHRGPGRTRVKECGCQDSCGCGDACDCCVPEADVVVRARAGEVRIVPFRLHNPWRREREVSLEIGPWHGCSGDGIEVRATLEEEKVVLGPCEDRVVRLRVLTSGSEDDGATTRTDKDTTSQEARADSGGRTAKPTQATGREPLDVAVGTPRRRTTDVGSCASAYADVRFEGCARPQRVAVVVLPADCDAVEVGCDCGCCC
jgi:hypothetical protein